ncbi:SDR family NAD(P)-dependent oxidoreductase [Aldersonia sp. NBC_00410]|uniref:SDR family NAD(P)-dependent oxidoreductase n=1 Tax=Aldersonia sp. NBC_00410 TaxID=2975954 RepID=UPI00224F0EFC|nr:SDR family NAD(P)-dependent oxidoreductase [Aldersonia sp. NBC_00410]MCX5042746.1 SDR family NAD(P)-dependent oxidoreductase [Aldersonia sp. NBC_00410]
MTFETTRPVVVVTGASSGIGRATAGELVARGGQVIGVGRDPGRCAAAAAEIVAAAADGGRFVMLRGDFALMADVARVAGEIRERTGRLDVVVNNAGGVRDRQLITAEGLEATFATNHLAPFLLTRELMPLLTATAADAPGTVRVIAVSSSAHRASRGLRWDDLQSLRNFHPSGAYCQAKLANLLFTRELAVRAAGDGVVALAMHPGAVASNFASHGDEQMQAHMAAIDTVPPEEPARTLVWLATDPEPGRAGGRYFHRMAVEEPAPQACDPDAAARLWTESEKLLAEVGY